MRRFVGFPGCSAGILCVLLNGCSAPKQPPDARFTAVFATIKAQVSDPEPRPCTILLPGRGERPPDGGYPAIIFLHGRGECGSDGLRSCAVGLPPAAIADPERWPFVIIVPQKPAQRDTWLAHDGYVLACLERACAEVRIDRARVYLTGLSQGGAGTWMIAARHPATFAAIAPVCGFLHDPDGPVSGMVNVSSDADRSDVASRLAAAGVPVWAFHGERDDVVLPEQSRLLISAMEASGGSTRASYFPGANHNAWDPAYRDNGAALAGWFLSHRLRAAP